VHSHTHYELDLQRQNEGENTVADKLVGFSAAARMATQVSRKHGLLLLLILILQTPRVVGRICYIHCTPNTTVGDGKALFVLKNVQCLVSNSGGLFTRILRTSQYHFRRAWIPLAVRVFSKARW
jgi:hypothetical protein